MPAINAADMQLCAGGCGVELAKVDEPAAIRQVNNGFYLDAGPMPCPDVAFRILGEPVSREPAGKMHLPCALRSEAEADTRDRGFLDRGDRYGCGFGLLSVVGTGTSANRETVILLARHPGPLRPQNSRQVHIT